MSKDQESNDSIKENLKRDFLYGLMLVVPIAATVWLVAFIIDLFSGPISVILGQRVPSFIGFLVSIILITLIGIVARNFIGRFLFDFFERILEKLPLVNIIYRSSKQIVDAFSFNQDKKNMTPVMVEYPRKGSWVIGFLTKEDATGISDRDGEDIGAGKCAVFLPTTPNPTSGFLIYVDASEVKKLDMSVETSVKVLMSAGVITPDTVDR